MLLCSIKNPLAHLSDEAITQDVNLFAETHGLTHITSLLLKGALIAKNPAMFEQVAGITEHEKQSVRNEVLHKWRQPRALYLAVAITCVGAAVQFVSPHSGKATAQANSFLQRMGSDWF